ncbi:MAG TPA: periplasmic heavy metal sensor [Bauldia sp.]|nr:periplasmic heavy metal sensor [Bauldia sp.]
MTAAIVSPAAPGARRRRFLVVALIASLAVNAFLVGVVATEFLGITDMFRPHGERAVSFELRWLQGRLSDASLERVRSAIDAARPRAEARLDRVRQLRRELGILVAAPQPDRAAIDAKLRDIRAELDLMATEVQKVSMDALLALPAAERAPLAEPRS